MIAKNEEPWIGRCLTSIHSYADEIIVVDTGSQDQTAAIVRSMGGCVYSFDWTGSFAEARNYGLNQAKGEWVMWLDADEEADAEQVGWLRELHRYETSNLLAVEMIHFNSSMQPHPDSAYRMMHHRLFRNGKGFRFEGDIHEQICNPYLSMEDEVRKCAVLPLTLLHYGYLEAVANSKNKFTRNFGMLQKKLAIMEEPDPWLLYHLASEYYRHKDYTTAFNQVNLAIRMALAKGRLPPALFYKLKYASLLETGSYDGAWPGIDKAILLYPDYVDLHFYKGCILLQRGNAEMAIPPFEECLRLGDAHPQYMTLQGAGSFYASYYLGLCYARMEDWEKASRMYRLSLESSPHFLPARQELDQLRILQHNISCFVVSESSAPQPESSLPPVVPRSAVASRLLTLGAALGPGDWEPSRLRRWLEEWDAYADEWVIADCGLQPEELEVVSPFAHHLVTFDESGMEWPQLVSSLREKATCGYFLWLNPADCLLPADSQELEALRHRLAVPDGKEMDGASLKLIWTVQDADGASVWTVRRNRLVGREVPADWNASLEEFILPPGALVHESGIHLHVDERWGSRST